MKHIHLIGIGGSGLSAIALLLLESGFKVSGSDRLLSPQARQLAVLGAVIHEGHDAKNICGADLVVRSSAISDDNPEVIAARSAGIPVLKRSDFLGDLMASKTGIAIAGSHGKTTTTSMTAWMLVALGRDPSYIIGGVSKNLGNNAHAGKGEHFVIEADEYDRMFLGLKPQIIALTNVQYDHPDCFPTREIYMEAFVDFANRIKPGGVILSSLADDGARIIMQQAPENCLKLTYGLDDSANYLIRNQKPNRKGGYSFEIWRRLGSPEHRFASNVTLQVPGEHNVLNATAALAILDQLGLPFEHTVEALSRFSGAERRFDVRGEVRGITIVDDYAHHPAEINTTLHAARSRYPFARLWAIWQPHTFTRIQALFNDFLTAFDAADEVIVTEIYAAREQQNNFSSAQVVEKMTHPHARFIAGLDAVSDYLLPRLKSGDVLLVLSAGDADKISTRLMDELEDQSEGGHINHA